MRQDRENSFASYAVLIAALIIIAMIAGSYLTIPKTANIIKTFPDGFTIDAISLANPPITGQTNEWIVSTHATGFGQSITGNLDSTEIKYSGIKARYPLYITGQISDNKGLYLIDNSNPKTVFKYRVEEKHGSVSNYYIYTSATPPAVCDGNPIYELHGSAPSGWLGFSTSTLYSRVCVYQDNVATVSSVSALPNIYPKIDTTITVNGQAQTITLDSLGAKSLPNMKGSVIWSNSPVQAGSIGALSVGAQYIAVAPYNTENWKVDYANDYSGAGVGQSWSNTADSINTEFASLRSSGINFPNIGCTVTSYDKLPNAAECFKNYISDKTSPANNLANKLLTSDIDIRISGSSRSTSYDPTKKGFWVDLSNIYSSAPQLQYRLSTDWVGAVFPNGVPQVISATGTPYPFKSGTPLTVSIQVKNIGDGTGNFIAQSINYGGLAQSAQVYPISVSPGSTGTITFTVITTGQQTGSGTISGMVVDTGSLRQSPFSLNYKMEQPSQCTDGKTYYFGGNKIQGCSNAKLYDLQTCQYGVVDDGNSGWKCALNPMPGTTSGTLTGTPTDTLTGNTKAAPYLNWYETPQAVLLMFLLIALILVGYVKYKEKR